MQAVIMVAGKSTRTYPLTLTRPKPLLPILNRPLIYFNLDQLVGLVDEVIFIVGYRKEMIEEMVGHEYRGMKLVYQEQKEQLGTGHALQQAEPHIENRFIVMNGDDIFAREDIEKLAAYKFAALAMEVTDPSLFGVIEADENGRLINLIEKPKTFSSNLANVGCYVFEPNFFPILAQTQPSERGEIEITSAILAIAQQEQVQTIKLTGYWLPTGYPWDILKSQRYLFDHYQIDYKINGIVEKGAMIHGKVHIGEGSIIQSGAQIFGPAIIGKNCKIGALSYIGPYTCIGDQTQVGNNCIIEGALVMAGCNIEAGSIVHHSVIGSTVCLDEACHLIAQLPGKKTIQSVVKKQWIDTNMPRLGAILADNVRLAAKTVTAPGCKLWPAVETSIGDYVEHDIVN